MNKQATKNEIPNLWPEISVNVLTPVAILRTQASQLRQMTQGLIVGEVTVTEGEKSIRLSLDLVAPSLDNYRYRLFSVQHNKDFVYPVRVVGHTSELPKLEFIQKGLKRRPRLTQRSKPYALQHIMSLVDTGLTQKEFIRWIGSVLRDKRTVGIIESLIARINEEKANPASHNINGQNTSI